MATGDFEEQGAGELETLVTELEAKVRQSAEDARRAAEAVEATKRAADERIARAEGALEEQRAQLKELKEAHIAQHRAGVNGMGGKARPKSAGAQFVETDGFKRCRETRDSGRVKIEIGHRASTIMTVADDVYANPQWTGKTVEVARRRPVAADALPSLPLESQGGIEYVRQTAHYLLHTVSTAQANSGQKVIAVKSVGGFSVGQTVVIIPVSGSNITEVLTDVTQTSDDSPAGTITVTNNLAANLAAGAQITCTTFAPTSEGDYKPSGKFVTESVTAPRKTLATSFTVSTRVLNAEGGQLAGLIDRYLPENLALVEEDQILNGTGAGSELTGILSDSDVLTFAWSDGEVGDNRGDALARGANAIRNANYEPTAIWLHNNDALALQLTKDAEGRYLFPTMQNGGVVNIPVTICKALPAGTAVILDLEMACCIYRDNGVMIRVFDQHEDYAARNLALVRAERDISFAIERPQAICVVTFDAEPS